MDPQDIIDSASPSEEKRDRLNDLIAVTIAILAVFLGVFHIKDDNIGQAMQQAQSDRVDNWGWYQAHKTRIDMGQSTVDMLKLQPASPSRDAALTAWNARLAKQKKEADETQDKAKESEKAYDALNYRDDQFDMSDSALSVAVALFAVTALTKRKLLYIVASVFAAFGLVLGLAGMFGWPIHPDALAKFLGT